MVALVVFGVTTGSVRFAGPVVVAGLLGILGLALVVGPWALRLVNDLGAERAERVRTQERADMAAHLHDSVLQTLALIQKNSGDATTVARLARAQERDLRTWLFEGEATDDTTLAGALRDVAASVEETHAVVVDVVTVGDCADSEAAADRRQRHPRGGGQRRPARRGAAGRRLRRGRRPTRSRSSSATAAPASTPTRWRPTATASATASSTAWPATAAAPRSVRRPVPAPRSACTCPCARNPAARGES